MTAPMPGYAPVSMVQMQAADEELFRYLADRTREGIRRQSDGRLPCDVWLEEAMNSRRVDRALATLPSTGQQKRQLQQAPAAAGGGAVSKRQKRKNNAAAKQQQAPAFAGAASWSPQPQVKGKGKAKNKGYDKGKG